MPTSSRRTSLKADRTQGHSLEKPDQRSMSQPEHTVATPLRLGGGTSRELRCDGKAGSSDGRWKSSFQDKFLAFNFFFSFSLCPTTSLLLRRTPAAVHYRPVSVWFLEEGMGLAVWKPGKTQPAKHRPKSSAGIADRSLKDSHQCPSEECAALFS